MTTLDPTHLALAVERHQPAGFHWVLLDGTVDPHEYTRLMEGGQTFDSYQAAFQAGLAALLKLVPEDLAETPASDRAGFSAPV